MGQGGSIAVGLADGVLKGLQIRRQWAREDEDRAAREQDRSAREEDRAYTRQQRQRADAAQIALENAAKPATVSQAGALPEGLQFASNEDADAAAAGQPNAPMPQVPRFRLEAGGNVQRFDTQQEADAAATQHNDPGAVTARVGQALLQAGKPTEALQYQQQAEKLGQERFRHRLGEAMGTGFGGIENFINTSEAGPFKGKKVKFVPSEDGKTVTLHVDNDGKLTPTKLTFPNDDKGPVQAGYMLDQAVTPEARYKLMVEEDRKKADQDRKERELDQKGDQLKVRERELEEVKKPIAEARAIALEARAGRDARAGSGSGGGDKASREERLRWTSLHSESGRRLSDAQKSLRTLQTDASFMVRAKKPGSPEAAQLANLQEDVTQYKADREMYGGLLGGSQAQEARAARDGGAGAPAAAPAATTAAPAAAAKPGRKVAAPTSKAEYDAIPKGARYQHPDDPPGTYRTKK